jgi:hypothetical protein|tara:strand:+ start:3664 stop:5019 length:1356 start_codon:yes stop_codon:yes gene_type:complete
MPTKLNPNQVNENTLEDADGNTKVQVEEASDENKIRFDTAGTERMIIDSNGRVGIGTSSPTTAFHVYADAQNAYVATIDNDAGTSAHGLKVETDGTGAGSIILDLVNGSSTVFKVRADGRVGIGVDTPGSTLAVDDEIAVGEKLLHRGDANTYLQFSAADTINLVAGGNSMIKMDQPNGVIKVNNGNNNIDFKIKDDAGDNLFHADAGTAKIGIGTGSPTELLSLNGVDDSAEPRIIFLEGDADRAKIGINSSNNLEIHQLYTNKHIVFKVNDAGQTREAFRMDGAVPEVVVNQTADSLVDFRVESNNNTHMLFVDGGEETVGINTSSPKCSLSVAGSMAMNVTSIGSSNDPGTSYTVAATDCVILVNTRPTAQGGIDSAITITLPAASDYPGRVVTIKDSAGYADVNAITIAGAGSDKINGIDSSTSLPTPASFKTLISDGSSAWQEIGN